MKCDNCDEKSEILTKAGKVSICCKCIKHIYKVSNGSNRIENDFLDFIYRNINAHPPKELIDKYADTFDPQAVLEGKTCLLDVYGKKIKEICATTHEEINRRRNDSPNREAFIANVHDIILALQTLDGA